MISTNPSEKYYIVKIGSFRGENRKSLKPSPRALEVFLLHVYICFSRVSRVSTCCLNFVICLSRWLAVSDLGRSSKLFFPLLPIIANQWLPMNILNEKRRSFLYYFGSIQKSTWPLSLFGYSGWTLMIFHQNVTEKDGNSPGSTW